MFDAAINALIGGLVFDVEVVAKLNPTPSADDVSFLGSDGRSYTLVFRKKLKNGTATTWKPVKFIANLV